MSATYFKENKALQFLVDVVTINAENFLSGSSDEDRKVQQDFQNFLSTYCVNYNLAQRIPEIFEESNVKVKRQCAHD